MQLQFDNIILNVRVHQVHEWALTTAEVALGYGIDEGTVRYHKSIHADELIEGKHFVSVGNPNAVGGQATTFWTKRGIIRLGFFVKSERAKRFRDWAEDLIIRVSEPQTPVLPTTYKDALRALLSKVEEKERLELENADLRPKAAYTETVLLSTSELTTTIIAKELGMSAQALNKILNQKGVQFKQNSTWVLYRCYQDKGLTRLRTHTHTSASTGELRTEHNLVWTEAGRQFIHQLINPALASQPVHSPSQAIA